MPDTAAKKKKTKNKTKINNEPQPYCQIRLTGKATGIRKGMSCGGGSGGGGGGERVRVSRRDITG